MAIDFDALDFVRTRNRAKMYEQKKREQLLKRVDNIIDKANNKLIEEDKVNKQQKNASSGAKVKSSTKPPYYLRPLHSVFNDQ